MSADHRSGRVAGTAGGVIAAVAVILSAVSAAAAPSQPCSRPVIFPGSGEEVYAVELDRGVYRVTPSDFADLRLIVGDGQEVPYKVEKVIEKIWRRATVPVSGRVASLRELPGNRLEVVWAPNADQGTATGLRFETAQRDFERKVSVYDERDTALVGDALLYDYSRFMDMRALEVRLPANSASQYRVVIDEITDEAVSPFTEITRSLSGKNEQGRQERYSLERRPMRIERVSAWREAMVEAENRERLNDYGAFDISVDDKSETGKTLVTVTTAREPLTALHIETDSRNFSRRVEVQAESVTGVQRGWRHVGGDTISVVQFRAFREAHLKVAFPERREARFRLVIHNGDSPPLRITGIRGEGPVYRMLFLHDGSRALRLEYGGAEMRPPAYDAAAVLGALGQKAQPVVARLGPAVSQEPAREAFAWRRWLNSQAAFVAITVLVVAVLAWSLFRAAKRVPGNEE